jgi:FAD/FMN-containing dehydrogenase
MAAPIIDYLRQLVGTDADFDTDAAGVPTVAPHTESAAKVIMRAAYDGRWKVRPGGHRSWSAPEAVGDVVFTSTRLTAPPRIQSGDLIATVPSGWGIDELNEALRAQGVWWPVDPPGRNRTIGSILGTATTGPLQSGFGPVRDQVLGLTVVTPDGRLIKAGGTVVKNVAGYDLTKLAIGSFGAFGFVTGAHLRLRALPESDATFVAVGDRDSLIEQGRAILETGVELSALHLTHESGGQANWTLRIRVMGSATAVEAAHRTMLPSRADVSFTRSSGDPEWQAVCARVTDHPVSIRLGPTTTALEMTLDLVADEVEAGNFDMSLRPPLIRWWGTASHEQLRNLRNTLAQREVPMTVERAPWSTLQAIGHFGAYREGVYRLVSGLRAVFDPSETIAVPLGVAP